jgi:hypothetical protein
MCGPNWTARIQSVSQAQLARREVILPTEPRKQQTPQLAKAQLSIHDRGYVALAVATERGTFSKELSTGLGGDREGNMIAFAVEALTLLRDVIKGDAKL